MEDPATSVTSSLWASLNSWFTSTVFFVLLNLMIATIVFTSNLPDNNQPNNHQQQQQDQEQQDQKKNANHDHNQPQIARSHSILNRLKSFNLYPQKSHHDSETHYQQHPLEVAATQYVFNQTPIEYQHFDSSFANPDQFQQPHVVDTDSRAEHVTTGYDFDQIRQETGMFDFHPTRQESGGDTGFNFDPTRKQTQRNKAFDFDPTRNGTDQTRPENANGKAVFDESDEEHEFESLDEVYSKLKTGGHDRTKSDGSIRQKPPPAKMKKSASLKVGFTHHEEEEEEIVEARRPATVKEKRSAVKVKDVDEDDVEVDSRADDFINKFKNDLMLQRMESIIRTKGATNRGGGR